MYASMINKDMQGDGKRCLRIHLYQETLILLPVSLVFITPLYSFDIHKKHEALFHLGKSAMA